MSTNLILVSVSILLAGGVLSAALGRWCRQSNLLGGSAAVLGAIPALVAGWTGLGAKDPADLLLPWSMPFGSFHIAVDSLSAFFVLPIALVCAMAAIYGVSYLRVYEGRKNLGFSWLSYNALFASMLLVVTARNGMLFLLSWEVMAVSSFLLVMFEHERPEVREAGWTYLVATHLGTAFLFVLFMLMGWEKGSLEFHDFSVPSGVASAGLLFLLALIGFGTKAGFMPMHVWLPEAHPAAPSHVSAVMSGVMLKTGIYGLIRTIQVLGGWEVWSPWWGWTLVVVGAVSAIMALLMALGQRDIKRVLAYSSVENIGIICIGLGMWILGRNSGTQLMTYMGLLGALVHVWNHALYKSLLFMGAGAVVHGAGSRNIEQLGGLIKRMRYTGLLFVVACLSVCALPPLNGFISEFPLFLGAFSGITSDPSNFSSSALGCLVALAALALIGGLAIACFTRLLGIAFLGEPRSDAAAHAHEASVTMLVPMFVLAGLCVAAGLFGHKLVHLAKPVITDLMPPVLPYATHFGFIVLEDMLWKVSVVFMALIAVALVLWVLRRILLSGRRLEESCTWDCGYAAPTPRMQYTASSYSWPIIDMFRFLIAPRVRTSGDSKVFPERMELETSTEDVFRRFGYGPLFRSVTWLADRLRWVQQGRIQLYILYIALALIALLLWKLGMVK